MPARPARGASSDGCSPESDPDRAQSFGVRRADPGRSSRVLRRPDCREPWRTKRISLRGNSTIRLTNASPPDILNQMVERPVQFDEVFHALSHEARRGMLGRLSAGQLTVGELAAPLAMSLAAASKHVQVLEKAGLVRREVSGRQHICRLDPAPLASALDWLRFYEPFWNDRLDALTALFTQPDESSET